MQRWPAPIDRLGTEERPWADWVRTPGGWQPDRGRPSTVRAQWLLWQAWRLGRWNELEHGFRQHGFDPFVTLVPCQSLASPDEDLPHDVRGPMATPSIDRHGWAFWLNAWPSPPNVWDAYRRAAGPLDPASLGVDVLWSRWFRHAEHRPAFNELLRRLDQAHQQGWSLAQHPGLDEALTHGWRYVDDARDRQGRFARLGRHFAELVERLQRWGVAWDAPGDDPDRTPRLWRLIQGQWMFLDSTEVEADGWIGRLLVNDPNLWDGPSGLQGFWAQAMEQDAPLLIPGEDLNDLMATWTTVQRVGERARLVRLAQTLPMEVRGRRRL